MSRPPTIRACFDGELVVDNFAGGGGASTGIERAIGRPVDIAINHSPEAIAMHRANHPGTHHFCENIWEVDPKVACGGKSVGLAWFSPDCTHFSRAKGCTPVKKSIRGLAWTVIRWATDVCPRVIVLENVEEFQTWGPLIGDRPDPDRMGETFRAWLAKLTDLGYTIEFTTLVAADYGTPTTRKRLFLVARKDGRGPAWPEQTHGKGCAEPWHPASEIIDWSIPCPSIFERKRPLAEATLRRIAAGIRRYVIESNDPFIIPITHRGDDRVHGIDEPMRTITAAHRGEFALVAPSIISNYGTSTGRDAREPLPTVTGSWGGHQGLVMPYIVRHGHYSTITGAGLREGCGAGTFRGQPLDHPLATVCATNDKHLVAAFLSKHYTGVVGQELARPFGTVTAREHFTLSTAFLTKYYGNGVVGQPLDRTLGTVTSWDHHALVQAFLIGYYSNGGSQSQSCKRPINTVTGKARFGLVTIHGQEYRIVDIGLRMLQPHELFAAQGFPRDYQIAPQHNGRPLSKTDQISLAGNAVCPQVAEAIVKANLAA